MKYMTIFFTSILVVVTSEEYYDKILDTVDSDAVLDDKFLRDNIECFLDEAQCSCINTIIKMVIPETIEQACAKCTPRQSRSVRRFYEELEARYPEDYQRFKQKYDPTGIKLYALRLAVVNA